jgi:hypothetical protein
MNEFGSRIAAQRLVLQLVNRRKWEREELFGLSSKAIDRWVTVNRIDPESQLVTQVQSAAAKLFFLANKSQEQVTDEYTSVASEFALIAKRIEVATR